MNPSCVYDIKFYSPEHKEGILTIQTNEANPLTSEWLDAEARIDQSTILVVLNGDQVCGYLIFWTVANSLHIIRIAVDPLHRKKGLATKLMQHMMISRPDFNEICLEVNVANHAALALYQKLGFQIERVRKAYYKNGEDALVMVLPKIHVSTT